MSHDSLSFGWRVGWRVGRESTQEADLVCCFVVSNESAARCDGAGPKLDAASALLLADRLGALADPVRLQILSMISTSPDGEVCACDFVGPISKSQPTVSHHLKVLAEAGLVDGDKRGRWIWYRLAPGAVNATTAALLDATS